MAQASSLLLRREFQGAIPVLEALYQRTDPLKDGQERLLLAWALVETGRVSDATKLMTVCPFPFVVNSEITPLTFPRYLFLRGVLEEQAGKRAEARRDYKLFLEYSGDVPDIFGDDARARKSLAALGAS